jgi:uncharacterized membrane protein YgdD (TMEM256/DUF423 family)
MNKNILFLTAILGGLGVALGAFGAHGLKEILGEQIKNWETAVKYQMIHVLAIFIVYNVKEIPIKSKNLISYLFLTGILFFSGSLYVITTGFIDPKYIWFITPLGGLSFISGWILLALNFLKK